MLRFLSLDQFPGIAAPADASVIEILRAIDANGLRSICLVDSDNNLVSFVTDGDVRRQLLSGRSLKQSLELNSERETVTAPNGTREDSIRNLMAERSISQVPVIEHGRLTGVWNFEQRVAVFAENVVGLIMAGGKGLRMRPLTEKVPKPLLRVGALPMLDHVILALNNLGIQKTFVSTGYLAEKISEHLDAKESRPQEIFLLREETPLGTAGALSLISPQEDFEHVLVVNGDVMYDGDLLPMLSHHLTTGSEITIGSTTYSTHIPFGVIRRENGRVSHVEEKPQIHLPIASGIYLISAKVVRGLTPGKRIDMPELIDYSLTRGQSVTDFPLPGKWVDVGNPDSLTLANQPW